MRTLVPLLALAALSVDVTAAHAGACAPQMPRASPLSATPTLAPGGAVVIGWNPAGHHGLHELATWTLRMRGKRVKTATVTLAPGLLALTPNHRDRPLRLVDERGNALARVAVTTTTAPPLAAPAITTLFLRTSQTRDGTRAEILADLAVPDDAAIALLYDAAAPATAPAISWTRVSPGVQATLYASPHRCEIQPDGMRGVAVGGKVQVAWLDRHGRVSPRSAPIEVAPDPVVPDPTRAPIPQWHR